MVLDCVLVDIEEDYEGNPVLDSNGDPEMENYSFKFKNTDRNEKEIDLEAGKIESKSELTISVYLDDENSPTVFYYINIDFAPPSN